MLGLDVLGASAPEVHAVRERTRHGEWRTACGRRASLARGWRLVEREPTCARCANPPGYDRRTGRFRR